jgi:hypothetical protein
VPTRADLIARRKQIADEIRAIPFGHRRDLIDYVAQQFGVCRGTVRSVCKEHRIKIPSRRTVNGNGRE